MRGPLALGSRPRADRLAMDEGQEVIRRPSYSVSVGRLSVKLDSDASRHVDDPALVSVVIPLAVVRADAVVCFPCVHTPSIAGGWDTNPGSSFSVPPLCYNGSMKTSTEPTQFETLSAMCGGGANPYLLTPQEASTKLAHNGERTDAYEQVVCYMLPHALGSRLWRAIVGTDPSWTWENLCPNSTPGCRAACLHASGRLAMDNGTRAKLARTALYNSDRDAFRTQLSNEIGRNRARVARKGRTLVVRVNGTTDIDILAEFSDIIDQNPDVIWQDYTKRPVSTGWVRPNVYRVRSATERTTAADWNPATDGNIVVPFNIARTGDLPATYWGRPVIDGDKHDLRILDRQDGVVVGLRYKPVRGGGEVARHGFIRPVPVTIG